MTDPRSIPRPCPRVLLAAASLLAVAGCAAIPDLGPRPQPETPARYAAERSFQAPAADWPSERWWDAYGDPQLSALIDEALKNSPTLAQAEARLRLAQAQAEQARAATLPSLSGAAQVAETEESRESGFPLFIQQLLPKGYQSTGEVTLNASYDLDLFGHNRDALAAAVSDTAAAQADTAQARLTLSTAVAQAYGELARLYAERDAAVATVANRAETTQLVTERVRNGLDTQGELKQAEANDPASQADVDALDEQILIARHLIAALLGAGPDRGLDIAPPKLDSVKPLTLPADLAAHLIGRRPDIVAARLRAEAAAKRIDAAKASFYPDVNLVGYIGQEALPLTALANPAAAIGSFGPAITLPIFEGGRLQGAYRGARADYDASVADYDHTLIQALQDVADSAASVQSAARQLEERRQALASGQAAYDIARLRYQGGLSTYVDVLSAEDALVIERRVAADAQARAFTLDVALVRALGGGFGGA